MAEQGRVVLVATPIGNLGDLSPRAVETLRGADVICCEDTRRTRVLLSAAGVPAPRLVALHQHNEAAGAEMAVRLAARGSVVAVVTDAGTPGVSDPGERVVRAAAAAGVEVSVVPGPTAAVAALVLSGLDTARWCFEGFLPRKGSQRAGRVAAVAAERRTSVLFEAPSRVEATLLDLVEACGADREVALARELTKLHEEVWRGRLGRAPAQVVAAGPVRGEWVIVLGGAAPAGPPDDAGILARLQEALDGGADRRSAVAAVAGELGVPKRRVYELSLAERSRRGAPPAAER